MHQRKVKPYAMNLFFKTLGIPYRSRPSIEIIDKMPRQRLQKELQTYNHSEMITATPRGTILHSVHIWRDVGSKGVEEMMSTIPQRLQLLQYKY